MHTSHSLATIALSLLFISTTAVPSLNRDCLAAGFHPGRLACSTCALLSSELPAGGAEAVLEDCNACCSPTLDLTSATRFTEVTLLMPPERHAGLFSMGGEASSWPGVNEFLEKSGWSRIIEREEGAGEWGEW